MRRGGAGLIAAVLALAGCKTTDPKPTDKQAGKEPAAAAASRPKGKGPSWLDDLNKQPGAGTAVPKADSWADPKDPNFNVATEVKGVLAGKVLDPAGRGVDNVYISIELVDAKPRDKDAAPIGIQTSAGGYFMTKGLKPGQAYNLTAQVQINGKPLYGIMQARTPNPTLTIQLREDVAMPPPAAPDRPGGTRRDPAPRPAAPAPPPSGALPQPAELIPPTGMPTAPARPGDEAWSPNGAPTNRSVPPTLPGPNSNPAPPPNPDPPKPSKPENFADGPKGPGWPPPASIPAPPVPPASSPPVPPLPPPKESGDGKTMSRRGRPVGNFTLLDPLERPWDFATSRSGSLVLVEFMTTTCVPCRQAIPVLVDLQARYGAAGLQVVAVACDDGSVADRIGLARKYHHDHHLNYSLYVEPGNVPGQARDRFGVEAYPTAILLDAAGSVVWKGHPGKRDELEAAIRQNLGN